MSIDLNVRKIKWLGLFVAIVLPVLIATSRLWTHNNNYDFTIWSYLLFIMPLVLLFVILIFFEKETITTLGNFKFNLNVAGIIILQLVVCLVINIAVLNIVRILNLNLPREPMYEKIQQLPVWGRILISLYAGFSEEIAYRGYAVTRLKFLTNNKVVTYVLPIFLFGIGHGANGSLFHIFYSAIIGIVFLIFYIRTNNLLANIVSHASFDLLFLVLVPLLNS